MQVDDDQQLIAKAIEESLMNAHKNPVYNEEEELNRILEMSKNQVWNIFSDRLKINLIFVKLKTNWIKILINLK